MFPETVDFEGRRGYTRETGMKYLFLSALLLQHPSMAAAEDAAPDLIRLEARLKQEQSSAGADSARYDAFLLKFRAELTDTMGRIPATPANNEAHSRILILLGGDAKAGAKMPDQTAAGRRRDVDATIVSGQEKLSNRDYSGALAAANEVLKTDPTNKNALFLKHASSGRAAPTSADGQMGARSTAEPASGAGNAQTPVTFTDPAKRKAVMGEVPSMGSDVSVPDDTSSPIWPLAAPFGIGLIGYGLYRSQKKETQGDSSFEVDRGGQATWGENEPLATPVERTPEQIANNRKNAKYAAIAGGVLLGGVAVVQLGPLVVAGAEGFFTSMGAASGGSLIPAYAGVGGGSTAAALNPAAVAAGTKVLGAAVVVAGEAKVASDYYSHAEAANPSGGSSNGVYKDSPKHGTSARGEEEAISKRPTNGQKALDNSTQIKPTSPRRIGVDPANDEIVVLDQTRAGEFHGHVRGWGALTDQMKNALIKAGFTSSLGKILSQ